MNKPYTPIPTDMFERVRKYIVDNWKERQAEISFVAGVDYWAVYRIRSTGIPPHYNTILALAEAINKIEGASPRKKR